MVRFLTRFSMLALVAAVGAGCSDPITVNNAVPRVTWLAATPTDDGNIIELTIWVSDIDGDTVDIAASWQADGESGPLVQASGSYGLIGLPTREALYEPEGQPHAVLWDISDLPSGEVRLSFVPDDRPYDSDEGLGLTAVSPAFDASTGLPDAVQLE